MRIEELKEAIQPGDRKEIDLAVAEYTRMKNELQRVRSSYNNATYDKDVPPEVEQQLKELIQAYTEKMTELEDKINNATDTPERRLEKLCVGIARHASDAVSVMKSANLFLYRGVKKYEVDSGRPMAFYGKPYNDRQPKDSSALISKVFNKLSAMAGIEARRSNSIFTTTNMHAASEFGHLYLIFPVNGFHYSWTTMHKDIVLGQDHWPSLWSTEKIQTIHKALQKYYDPKEMAKVVNDYSNIDPKLPPLVPNRTQSLFNSASWKNHITTLNMALEVGMLPKDLRPLIPEDYHEENLLPLIGDDSPQALIKNFGLLADQELDRAMNERHEILINGPYYAIDVLYMDRVRRYLGIGNSDENY